MRVRMFDDEVTLAHEVVGLLQHHFDMEADFPHAVMLSGGRTPIPIYRAIAASGRKAHRRLHILLSDERFVPESSQESNYHYVRPLAEALEVTEGHFHRVHTDTTLASAARRYDHELETFFRQGGHLTLGLLGLGEDGHTASLFSPGDIIRGVGKHAIPVHTFFRTGSGVGHADRAAACGAARFSGGGEIEAGNPDPDPGKTGDSRRLLSRQRSKEDGGSGTATNRSPNYYRWRSKRTGRGIDSCPARSDNGGNRRAWVFTVEPQGLAVFPPSQRY